MEFIGVLLANSCVLTKIREDFEGFFEEVDVITHDPEEKRTMRGLLLVATITVRIACVRGVRVIADLIGIRTYFRKMGNRDIVILWVVRVTQNFIEEVCGTASATNTVIGVTPNFSRTRISRFAKEIPIGIRVMEKETGVSPAITLTKIGDVVQNCGGDCISDVLAEI